MSAPEATPKASRKYECADYVDMLYPQFAFPPGAEQTEQNEAYQRMLQAANECLNVNYGGKCSTTGNLFTMVQTRERVDELLGRAKTFEKDGYPVYDTVALAEIQEALGFLFTRLAVYCRQDLFNQTASDLIAAYDGRGAGGQSLADIVRDWQGFDRDMKYSHAQTHVRYLKGTEAKAAKLFSIMGNGVTTLTAIFPR